ncbi:MAG TPA: hypothetical protein VLJ17_14415 [Xanthobacteraceae bacterium]|nr:hypothetical protein [Xanthobacteraceae bacterium]
MKIFARLSCRFVGAVAIAARPDAVGAVLHRRRAGTGNTAESSWRASIACAIRRLAVEGGLPFDPAPLPAPGNNAAIYRSGRRNGAQKE